MFDVKMRKPCLRIFLQLSGIRPDDHHNPRILLIRSILQILYSYHQKWTIPILSQIRLSDFSSAVY